MLFSAFSRRIVDRINRESIDKKRKEIVAAKAVDSVKLEDKILIELRVLQNRLFGSP